MSDDVTLADIADALARLELNTATAVERLELRIVALEARLIVQHGSMGVPAGDSAPGVITQAEPNAPR